MTESDVLARAARALREAHTGEREGSGFTRARIMNSVHRERRGRTLRWAILSPVASLLLVGSAWAQSTGKWPVIWKAVTSVFVAAPATSSAPPPASERPRERPSTPRAEQPVPSPELAVDAGAADAPPAPEAVQPAEDEGPRLGAAPEKGKRRAVEPLRRRPRPSPAPSPSSLASEPSEPAREAPPEPERDRELGRFRRAHDLHFKGSASAAIDAYAEYLREYPEGRFVPEARYAMALDQIKLGNDAAAREALAPFAAGHYGGYRQKEARTLLRALDEKKKAPGR
jgi:TolA-binding protein